MTKSFIFLWCIELFLLMSVNGQNYNEKHRLQVHFSTPSGWSNDPNGLVYADGAYHMYYQHHPNDTKNGPMHWGHAKSYDLLHWINMPIAIYPDANGVIFSGCCLLDKNNVTGVIPSTNTTVTPIIAIYTLSSNVTGQSQAMAYSFDSGLTYTKYANNPIIANPGIVDFRDPNIFERNGVFFMVLAVRNRLHFYSSTDLLAWTFVNEFMAVTDEGVWECPSLITLKDEQNNEHDVIILSLSNNDLPTGQTIYFIGKWNGTAFNSYNTTTVRQVDAGYDNYAGIPFHNDPLGRIVFIGWLSNWIYAQEIPTSTWRGQMTIARVLSLKTVNGTPHLAQRPIDTLNSAIDPWRMWSLQQPLDIFGQQIVDLTSKIPFKMGSTLALAYIVDIENAANGKIELQFGNTKGEFVSFSYLVGNGIYELDRRHSGDTSFSVKFANTVARAERIDTGSNLLRGQIILDTSSIEIFADDGLNTFSAIFFPTESYETIKLNITQNVNDLTKSVRVQHLNVAPLNSIWTNDMEGSLPNGSMDISATIYCFVVCLIVRMI